MSKYIKKHEGTFPIKYNIYYCSQIECVIIEEVPKKCLSVIPFPLLNLLKHILKELSRKLSSSL